MSFLHSISTINSTISKPKLHLVIAVKPTTKDILLTPGMPLFIFEENTTSAKLAHFSKTK
jgi:hypothetical protein